MTARTHLDEDGRIALGDFEEAARDVLARGDDLGMLRQLGGGVLEDAADDLEGGDLEEHRLELRGGGAKRGREEGRVQWALLDDRATRCVV